jgi:integrase
MAKLRKDNRGRSLKPGEVQRSSDGRYIYTYTDPLGRRKFIYARDLAELREKERALQRDQLDGLNVYAAGKATVNDTFDRYIKTKPNLRDSTRSNYMYLYDRFVREDFGKKKLIDIKYSDILQYYLHFINDQDLSIATVDNIHTLLHPTFQMAVRDDIIRKNPTDGVMAEITKKTGIHRGVRHALTAEQQKAFMDYIANHPVYVHWWPMFTILLGTGCRIGEALGLRWEDIDFEKGTISINHNLTYYPTSADRTSEFHIHQPKTEAGIRTIPLLDSVRDALDILREDEEANGGNDQVIDGFSGFIFQNRYGTMPNPASVNRAIKRILNSYNAEEQLNAAKEGREPVLLPDFSCHHLRHTFATRLCEVESNLKVIQSIMGHKNIETTMDIYAEATDRKKEEAFENLAVKLDELF